MVSPLSLSAGEIHFPLSPIPIEAELALPPEENIIILNEPLRHEVKEIHQPELQEIIEQIRQLARWPKSADPEQIVLLPSQLNEALQRDPCFRLEQIQVRILQLEEMIRQSQKLPNSERLTSVLNQHLLHAQQAASLFYRDSATPVQDSLWPLYERILRLPTLEPDLFGTAVAVLQEKLLNADSSNPLTEELQILLPKLLPPAHYLWGQEPPFDAVLEELKQIKQKSRLLLHRMEKTEGYLKNFYAPLQSIYETYRSFLEEFKSASEHKKAALSIPKAQLSGVGLGFFSLDQEVARRLLCRNEKGKTEKTNHLGTHAVHREAGIFYKPNPEGMYYIGPEMEFAIYAFYQLLGRNGAAPTALAKIRHLFFEEQPLPYGRVLQAGYGVEGISLQDLLGMANVLPYLERSLGIKGAEQAFGELLDPQCEQQFLEAHPELSEEAVASLSVEESTERFIQVFEAIFEPLPETKRCLEFTELPASQATKRAFYSHISTHSTQLLVGALAFLWRYPDLAITYCEKKVRPASFTEITDLCLYLKKSKQCFPQLSNQQLLQELPQLMNRFDPADFSAHFVVTLLTDPYDHKTDNLMVTIDRTAQGGVQSLSIVGIDNDLAFAPSEEGIKTILYLLPAMQMPFDRSITQKLLETTPERLVLDWLVALEEQNQSYQRWQNQGVLTQQDRFEDGEPSLHIPMEVDVELIPAIYAKAQKLAELLRSNPSVTHRDLLKAMRPKLAQAYEKALRTNDTPERAYVDVPRSFTERGQAAPASSLKQTPAAAALSFLKSLDLASFPLTLQVSLIGKALHSFPSSAHSLLLPGSPKDPRSRRDFFLMAVQQGHCALVARLLEEEKKSGLGNKKTFASLIELKNQEEQTALLLACCRLDLEMIRLLIHHGADPQVYDAGGRTALSLCLMRLPDAPGKVAAVVRFLGEQARVSFNAAGEDSGWGPLHHLVNVASGAPEAAEPLMTYLIEKGATADLVDNSGKTPLDRAIQQGQERWVEQLIRLGAGRTLNTRVARDFFAERPHLNEIYLVLQNQSLLLRWHLALDALRASSVPSQVTLKGAQLGTISLAPDLINNLLDSQGDIQPQIDYGRRNVNKITLADGNELYFKQYPEMPGVEYAIDTLFEILIGHGTSFTDLARLTTQNGKSYPVLISQGIKGDNLYDVLSDPQKAKQLDKLDPLAFSELLLASMLVNFEDAKPDNFILEQVPNGTYRVVGIDNDHAFVLPLLKEKGKTVLQVKNILYCLDQMKSPIHPLARERFLSFDPERFLRLWLKRLEMQNESYCALFSGKERSALFKESKKNPGLVIPIPFKDGAIVDIYQKFERLQTALRESPELTGMELLRLVIPELGIRYQEAFEAGNTPLNRFFTLFKTQYSLAIAGRYQTLVNSRQMLRSMAIPEKSAWEQASEGGPTRALRALEALKREIQATGEELKRIRDALQAGNIEPFMQLLSNTTKEKVINGLRGVYEGIDFKAMQIKGKPDLKRQETIFAAILTGNYRTLRLSGCAVLDRTTLRELLRRSPQLLRLKLSDCPNINEEVLTSLSDASYLLDLHLSELPQLRQLAIPHASLRHLQIEKCHELQQLTISHTLKTLSIDACWNLTDIEARLFETSFFRGARLIREAPDDFVLDRLRLKACPKLQPWWRIFAEWLKASPKNGIDLRKISLKAKKYEELLLEIAKYQTSGLKKLELSNRWVTGSKLLTTLLENCPGLTSLDLTRCQQITDSRLKAVAQVCPGLTSLHLSGCTQITDSGLKAVTQGCHGLTSLNLGGGKQITDSGLKQVAEACPSLTSLDLNACEQITDSGLKALTERCPGLTSLDLSECKQITDSGLKAVADGCPGLTNLDLRMCEQITDNVLKALAEKCPDLTSLDLSDCGMITDSGLKTLAKGCPRLTSLNLSVGQNTPSNITDSGLKALAEGCPGLTSLDLSECKQITDSGLKALAEKCPNLTSLDLSECKLITDSGLKALTDGCPGLTSLDLSECKLITDSGLKALTDGCPGLTSLDLSECKQITDSGLKALADGCPGLTSLNLRHCSQITHSGLIAVAEGCPGLTNLNLSLFARITDDGLRAVVNGCPGLTSLNLQMYTNFTDKGLKALAEGCPGLTSLNLSACVQITDKGLKALAKECPGLTSLDLLCCEQITDSGLKALAKGCHSLTSLNLMGCDKITNSGLKAVQDRHPGIAIERP